MKVNKLTKYYNGVKVLDNFSFDANIGDIVAVLAPSGAGKTTLINCIAGLTSYEEGSIVGYENLSMIFQEDRLLPWLTASNNIKIICKDEKKTTMLLEMVGIDKNSFHKFPRELSGGMKKRINIARGLSVKCDLLLMDEAFNGVNDKFKLPIVNYIASNNHDKVTILITHDIPSSFAIANRVMVFTGPPLTLYKEYSNFDKRNVEDFILEVKTVL